MNERRQHSAPLLVSPDKNDTQVERLMPINLKHQNDADFYYDESWLQKLIHQAPKILPILDIEPGFGDPISICTELPTPAGFADNFLITPNGQLILVECKLWRNPESRRKVLVQVIDYASCFANWSYEDLEGAVKRAHRPGGGHDFVSLWEMVSEVSELDERDFVNAVARNLRLGRVLMIIVGDGIDEGVERLSTIVQSHAGLHYAIALVELALFKHPLDSKILVHPRVVARTVNIERGIVRMASDGIFIEATQTETTTKGKSPGGTLSEDAFFEQLAKVEPDLPDRVKSFCDQVQGLGVSIEFKRTLILRWHAIDGSAFNLGYINTSGALWTDAINWTADQLNMLELSHAYVSTLASVVGGEVKVMPNSNSTYAALNGKCVSISAMLEHEEEWMNAISVFTSAVNERVASSGKS